MLSKMPCFTQHNRWCILIYHIGQWIGIDPYKTVSYCLIVYGPGLLWNYRILWELYKQFLGISGVDISILLLTDFYCAKYQFLYQGQVVTDSSPILSE